MALDDPESPTAAWKRRGEGLLAAGTWSPTLGRTAHARGTYPVLTHSAHGCRTIDTHGRSYVDWLMGWGTALLGFGHPAVEAAIHAQAAQAYTPSLPTPLQIEVAERLAALVPCARRVAFAKNGSDVLALAVRLARIHTGRERVLFNGYHGVHDWFMCAVPACGGVPKALGGSAEPLAWNDVESTRAALEREPLPAALVLDCFDPAPGYLEAVRADCTRLGIVLVFDEVQSGLRIARGGAQQRFGVLPDLACYAKSLANGLPLSALVGPEELAHHMPRACFGLTFTNDTLALAAARAALEVHANEPVAEHVARVGAQLRAELAAAAQRLGAPLRIAGLDARFDLHFEPTHGCSALELRTLFVQESLVRGVLHHGHFLPSYAHDEQALELSARALGEALEVVASACLRGDAAERLEMPRLALWLDAQA